MNLARAIEIAVQAHAGQTDKAGAPYILHPLRVMFAVEGEEARIVAVLHDVIEDCPDWTMDRLRDEGFSRNVLQAMEFVTKLPQDADYSAFVARAAGHPVARLVKRADLLDNLDITRLSRITPEDTARLNRYLAALATLTDC